MADAKAIPWYKSRTLLVNILVIISSFGVWAGTGFEQEMGVTVAIPTIISALLRLDTSAPIQSVRTHD
jgi:hypothetical protein